MARVLEVDDAPPEAPLVVLADRRKFAVHLVDVAAARVYTLAVAANHMHTYAT
jgi:hypothetical protein